jgi:hypothetical protein
MRSLARVVRCLVLLCVVGAPPCSAAVFSFHVEGDAGSWAAVLGSMGLMRGTAADAGVIVVSSNAKSAAIDWAARVDHGALLVIEGDSTVAAAFGFRSTSASVAVRAVEDLRAPKLDIVWEHELNLPRFETPSDARVFARERHGGAPLLAGLRRGSGAVLWMAAPPGERGYERFPYLPQALLDLGMALPFRSSRLWAFFDSSYRARVDLDYFAARWRESGIAALHVAAWHYWERDPAADAYLDQLIQACHRHSILVYAWFELPHVSERFWADHPEWREKTALLQDAQLDWRKLINLTNRDASTAVAAGLSEVVGRFDWDGVNLAEMYFESLEGHENAARFTPMNHDVRAKFQAEAGFDPLELFDEHSPRFYRTKAAGMVRFLEFRTELARRLEQEWIGRVDQIRKDKPHLDLVLTHVDDRFDPAMREKIGADAERTLPLLKSSDFTFLVEDPATLWNLGPERYPTIAARYRAIAPRPEKLAIDVNVVERYQDVYPTKQQTGAELFQVIHTAAAAFPRVALYFESSITAQDWPLLASAAADVISAEHTLNGWTVNSRSGVTMAWQGPALVDGRPWPATTGSAVRLPAGSHTVEPAPAHPPLRILDFNGELKSVTATESGVEFVYESSSRVLVQLEGTPSHVSIDGVATPPEISNGVVTLPRGQHLVTMRR